MTVFGMVFLGLALSAAFSLIKPQKAEAAFSCWMNTPTRSGQQVTFSLGWSVTPNQYGGPDYGEFKLDSGSYAIGGTTRTYTFAYGSTHTVRANIQFIGTETYVQGGRIKTRTWKNGSVCGSRTYTMPQPPNNPASAIPYGSCSAAGVLNVYVDVYDADGGTPGFSMHIDYIGDFGMDYGGDGWRGPWNGPRNGVTYNIWTHAVDPQTGGVYGPFYGTYNCPRPPPPPTCSLSVNPALIALNGSSTLSWSSANASSFSVDQGVGALSPVAGGNRTVFPGTTKTYTGSVSGSGGSATCSTTITVGSIGCTLNSILSIEPGESYTPSVVLSYAGGATTVSATITVTVTGQAARTYSVPPTPVPGDTSLTLSVGPAMTFPLPNNYSVVTKSVSGTVNGVAYGPTTCGGATFVPVVLKPYFKVFNGGVTIGAGFNSGTTTCSSVTTGKISGFASNSTGFLRGASTQYDLKALNSVADTFYSSGGSPPSANNYKSLTFANNSVADPYGGNYGGSSCITDYYATTKITGIDTIPGGVSNIGAIDAIAETNNQDQIESLASRTLSGGSLGNGDKLAIYITGDVYITGNITLETDYDNVDDIPFFALVVKGNIMIAPGVLRLDGLYIAQPNGGSGGGVYTCATSATTIPASTALYGSCGNKLTFNGSVVAKSIKLLRTFKTLRDAPANEIATSSPNSAAEVFNGMPELFIANPAFKIDDSNAGLYDSVTNLPPIL